MPKEQQALIHTTLEKSKIIKILREHELLNDCIQVADFQEWTAGIKKMASESSPAAKAAISELRLAFK